MDYEQWLQKAKETIDRQISPEEKFEVKELFPGHEWNTISRGERTGFGSYFSRAVVEGRLKSVIKCENGKIDITNMLRGDKYGSISTTCSILDSTQLFHR